MTRPHTQAGCAAGQGWVAGRAWTAWTVRDLGGSVLYARVLTAYWRGLLRSKGLQVAEHKTALAPEDRSELARLFAMTAPSFGNESPTPTIRAPCLRAVTHTLCFSALPKQRRRRVPRSNPRPLALRSCSHPLAPHLHEALAPFTLLALRHRGNNPNAAPECPTPTADG